MGIKLSNRAFWALVVIGCTAILSGRAGSQDTGGSVRDGTVSHVNPDGTTTWHFEQDPPNLRARSLTIVDEAGRDRITLRCDEGNVENGSRLRLIDRTGKHQASIGVMDSGPLPNAYARTYTFLRDEDGAKETSVGLVSSTTSLTGLEMHRYGKGTAKALQLDVAQDGKEVRAPGK